MRQKRSFFVSAIIVAGGKGTRMNLGINKQYVELYGKMVLARTLQAFEDSAAIDEIILVVNSEDILFCNDEIVESYGLKKVKSIVAGGQERQESVYNGLMDINVQTDFILIHDGARPLVDHETIEACVMEAVKTGAATAAVPVKDTIKAVDSDGNIAHTLDRSTLWSIQTPQCFESSLLKEAHEKARSDGFSGTDDCVLVERLGCKVPVVEGNYRNIKITTKEDIVVAKAFIIAQDPHF